jgi:RNA-directed DNA polymerase
VNTRDPESSLYWAERRVLEIQAKLHRWASDDPHRRFDDLFNLVTDPAFLVVAWDRVRNNKGARTAGVDGETARYIEAVRGLEGFLGELRAEAGRLAPSGLCRRSGGRSPKRAGRFAIWGLRR